MEEAPKAKWERKRASALDSLTLDSQGKLIDTRPAEDEVHKVEKITKSIRRNLIRYLIITLDLSQSSELDQFDLDFRPSRTRLLAVTEHLGKFIRNFYNQNPISQLGLSATKEGKRFQLSRLSSNPKLHLQKLKSKTDMQLKGVPSLQNTIEAALVELKHVPEYAHRQLLIIYSSISTIDPGVIFDTITKAQQAKLRISVISLVSEMYICRKITEMTGGRFDVAINAPHLEELLKWHTAPPPELVPSSSSSSSSSMVSSDSLSLEAPEAHWIYTGFPKRRMDRFPLFTFQLNHSKGGGGGQEGGDREREAYLCPRCLTRIKDLPSQCAVCDLSLHSSSDIARSAQQLFPINPYLQIKHKQQQQQQQQQVVKVENLTLSLSSSSSSSSSTPLPTSTPSLKLKLKLGSSSSLESSSSPSVSPPASACSSSTSSTASTTSTPPSATPPPTPTKVMICAGCFDPLSTFPHHYQCPICEGLYCPDCNVFIHDDLYNCPTTSSSCHSK